MAWTDGPTAILALRTLIKDNANDKYCAQKKVIGVIDGTNTQFKTFENRRVTDFTTAVAPLGVFINGAYVAAASDDLASANIGSFTLTTAPTQTGRQVVTASYYYQWFLDPEIDQFLQNAATWLGFSTTYATIPDGLNAAALRFSAQEAYEAVAMKYSTRMAEIYKLEDAPSEDILKSVEAFQAMSDSYLAKAETMRDDFYTRQGQALAPNYAFALGRVRDPVPRR
jgi:hypothetical protein